MHKRAAWECRFSMWLAEGCLATEPFVLLQLHVKVCTLDDRRCFFFMRTWIAVVSLGTFDLFSIFAIFPLL